MIETSRLNELIKNRSELFVMHWFYFDLELQIIKHNLNEHYKVKNDYLYYDNKCINKLLMCYENIDLKEFIATNKYKKICFDAR